MSYILVVPKSYIYLIIVQSIEDSVARKLYSSLVYIRSYCMVRPSLVMTTREFYVFFKVFEEIHKTVLFI